MKTWWFALLLSGSFLLAQDTNPANAKQQKKRFPKMRSRCRAALADPAAITF